jgi:hypothetical protein
VTLLTSRLGAVLAVVYLLAGAYITQDELRHSAGGWISLRGMMTGIVTAPSQVTLGLVLRGLGVPKVDFADPGASGYAELLAHLAISTAVVYLLGAGIEWVARWALARG